MLCAVLYWKAAREAYSLSNAGRLSVGVVLLNYNMHILVDNT